MENALDATILDVADNQRSLDVTADAVVTTAVDAQARMPADATVVAPNDAQEQGPTSRSVAEQTASPTAASPVVPSETNASPETSKRMSSVPVTPAQDSRGRQLVEFTPSPVSTASAVQKLTPGSLLDHAAAVMEALESERQTSLPEAAVPLVQGHTQDMSPGSLIVWADLAMEMIDREGQDVGRVGTTEAFTTPIKKVGDVTNHGIQLVPYALSPSSAASSPTASNGKSMAKKIASSPAIAKNLQVQLVPYALSPSSAASSPTASAMTITTKTGSFNRANLKDHAIQLVPYALSPSSTTSSPTSLPLYDSAKLSAPSVPADQASGQEETEPQPMRTPTGVLERQSAWNAKKRTIKKEAKTPREPPTKKQKLTIRQRAFRRL